MTWRSDWNRANRAMYRAQRLSRDAYVGTGPDGGRRLARRLVRRSIVRNLLRGLR